jgi:hypothetical protein
MGRFGAFDGLIMLGLQLALVYAGVYCGARAALKPWRILAAAGLSFLLAFVVHILVLNGLKHGWTAAYESLLLKRSIVALAWGAATWLALWLSLRPLTTAAVLLGAGGGAVAYLIFAAWRA